MSNFEGSDDELYIADIVFSAITSELEYQKNDQDQCPSLQEEVKNIEKLSNDALVSASFMKEEEEDEETKDAILSKIREIAAVAVRAMKNHGIVLRHDDRR